MKISVSPRFTLDTTALKVYEDLQPETKVHEFDSQELPPHIFKDRMDGWFFSPARDLLARGHDVAAIHIVTPLIEALEEHYKGKSSVGQSKAYFCARASMLFQVSPDAIDLLYKGVRCGFAHHGFLKDDNEHYCIAITTDLDDPLVYRDFALWIDSQKYFEVVEGAFRRYYSELEANTELRNRFLKLWWKDWQMSLRVPGGLGRSINNNT